MKCKTVLGAFSLLISLALTVPVLADPPEGKGKPEKAEKAEKAGKPHGKHTSGDEASTSGGRLVAAGISAATARQYAHEARLDMGGYKSLPPGIQKNLARGKPLPPGIAKKMAPNGLLSRLPHHPGYDWQVAGTDLILVQAGTAVVAEVLKDVFR